MKLTCPNCGSHNIDQYRMLTGPIYCTDCEFRADAKEKYNPFIKYSVAIVGSRSFNDYEKLKSFITDKIDVSKIDLIISGGAQGADTLGARFSKDVIKKDPKIFYADWDKYGKPAGYIRNVEIVKASDIVFAFWDGKSKGTKHSIGLAKKHNKKLYICEI